MILDTILSPYLAKDYYKLYYYIKDKSLSVNTEDISTVLLAVACIEVMDYNKSKELFEMIRPDSPIYSVACWYLALLHLRTKDYQKTQEYLKIASEENLEYGEKARSLLDTVAILIKNPK